MVVVGHTEQERAKERAGRAALPELPEKGIIGLGTGSTTRYFIEGVGELVKKGAQLSGVPTSQVSRQQATGLGIPLLDDDGPWSIDVTVDGADEVDSRLNLIKGGGGAHTREKIVNLASAKNVIIVDATKLSARLGEKWPVPVEVFAFGHGATAALLRRFGRVALRMKDGSAIRTDAGNHVYDVHTGPMDDPEAMDRSMRALPGVVETGIFIQRADVVLVAHPDRVERLERLKSG